MSTISGTWQWSQQYGRYYRTTTDASGSIDVEWADLDPQTQPVLGSASDPYWNTTAGIVHAAGEVTRTKNPGAPAAPPPSWPPVNPPAPRASAAGASIAPGDDQYGLRNHPITGIDSTSNIMQAVSDDLGENDYEWAKPAQDSSTQNYRATSASQNYFQQYSASNNTVNYGGSQIQSSSSAQPMYHSSRFRRTDIGFGQSLPRGQGAYIQGDYVAGRSLYYESLDPSFYVRDSSFFTVGKVFAVMWIETASATATPTDYNTSKSLTQVKYDGNYVHTNVRRFIVVRKQAEFCYACPIYTYSGRATLKGGVRPEQHAIAYSWGGTAQLLRGEYGITKASISVVMTNNNPALDVASRIYFGIYHPIQYNVKVKEIGYVPSDQIATLIGNWREEDVRELGQASDVTANAEREELAPVNR